jgi:hypothetical protein
MSVAIAPSVQPPSRVTRRFGMPFDGHTSSVPAHLCPPGKVHSQTPPTSSHSVNMLYDPVENKFFRRSGSATVGGSNGILESGPSSMRARQLSSLQSPSIEDLGDKYPTHSVLYTRESATAANNNAALYVRSTIGSVDYTLGMEYSANHYPGTTAATANIKCIPYYRTTDGLWGRLNSATKRQYALAGSRQMIEAGNYLYLPNLYSMPMRWNKRYNESSASGSQNLRLMPTGGIPPLGLPTITTGTVNAAGVWQSGDRFYFSVVFQYEDGSFSLPMVPRPVGDIHTGGFLLVYSLGANCNFVQWGSIPIGPDGTVARWLLRSPKFNSAGNTTEPDPLDLRVTAYIPNNTQESYIDFNGNDLALATRTDVVNFARQWPNPGRHISQFDGRFITGYLNPHPAAIILAPTTNLNVQDDDVSIISNTYEFDVGATTANKLTLYKNNATDATSKIGIASTDTIQTVVDNINALTGGGAAGAWRAAVAPGADASAPANTLCGTSTAGTPAGPADIDVGDTSKRVRAFCPAYPGIAYFSTAYLTAAERKGPFKNRWRYSEGGPQLSGSNFGDMWPAGNIRTGYASWGIYMGAAPLLDGCLIFFSKAVVLFRNIKSGRSGNDEDYHPDDLFPNIGCISSGSIAYGDGWAGCLTDRGYYVFDGTRQGFACISGDLWNPVTQVGEWAYEIAQSVAGVAKDDDSSRFEAKVMGGELICTYRSDSSASGGLQNYQIRYNFTASQAGSGIAQVLRPDNTPWGWSAPLDLSLCVLGEVRKSTGVVRYGTIETNAGATNGRVDQFDTGTQDNGSNVVAQLRLALDLGDSMRKSSAQEIAVFYKVNGTGAQIDLRLDDGSGNAASVLGSGIALPTTGASGRFSRFRFPLPGAARAAVIGHQLRFSDDGTGGALEVWGAEMYLVQTSSYT